MADNAEQRYEEILHGIRYLIGENKDLREDLLEFARKAEVDRKSYEADRRRSDERFERMMLKMDEDRRASDARFNLMMKGVVRVGNRIVTTQKEHTKLLGAILKVLRVRANGPGGTGRAGQGK